MRQRLGHEDEHAAGAANGEQALQDQAGLDGFAQTDLIGEQDTRDLARGDLLQNIDLMRNKFEAAAKEAANVG